LYPHSVVIKRDSSRNPVRVVCSFDLFNPNRIVFVGGNNITLSQSTNAGGATITMSGPNVGGAQTGISGISAGTTLATAGTVSFANSNGISFGVNGNTLTASYTVPTQSVQTQNIQHVSLSGNTAGVMGAISSGTMVLAGGNNITVSQNGNSVTLSGPNAQTGVSGISAGTTQISSGTAIFSNSNGITFGLNGNTLTASHNGLTTAALSNHSHGVTLNLTNINGTTGGNSNGLSLSLSVAPQTQYVFSNSNNVSFGTNGSTVTATASFVQSVQTQNSVSIQNSTGNISFANANGITFGFNASTITASHNGLTTAALSDHSHGNPILALTNISGTTASNSNGFTLSLSVEPPGGGGGGGVAISGGGSSQSTGTVNFSNSNGVSFGLNAGVMTASVVGGGIAANGVTASTGVFEFSNGNGVTFGLNTGGGSNILTASVGAGLGQATLGFWQNLPFISNTTNQTFGGTGATTGSYRVFPIQLESPVSFSHLGLIMSHNFVSTAVAMSQTLSHYYGLFNSTGGSISTNSYTVAISQTGVSGTISSYNSTNGYFSSSWNASATVQSLFGTVGLHQYLLPLTSTLSQGNYLIGFFQRMSTVGAAAGLYPALAGAIRGPNISIRTPGQNATAFSNSSVQSVHAWRERFNGVVSSSVSTNQTIINTTQIANTATYYPWIQLR
jgi:hypothetical protein